MVITAAITTAMRPSYGLESLFEQQGAADSRSQNAYAPQEA